MADHASTRLTLSAIEPVPPGRWTGRFHYRVRFKVDREEDAAEIAVVVRFSHGKRKRSPHIDEIEREGREQVGRFLAQVSKSERESGARGS